MIVASLQIDDWPKVMEIKNGARVMLKTSSPPMQVIEVRPDGWLICQWMHDGKLTSKAFPLSALRTDTEHATCRKEVIGGFKPRQMMTVVEHLDVETITPKVRCVWFEQDRLCEQVFGWPQIEVESWMNGPRFKHVPLPEPKPHWFERFPLEKK